MKLASASKQVKEKGNRMTTLTVPIEFSLEYQQRLDEETKLHVGYIPKLRLYSQARTPERLAEAIKKTAIAFIGLCWERGILDDVMRERGLRKMEPMTIPAIKAKKGQFIKVGAAELDAYSEVPISLLAGKQETVECHR
jgi:hypothetical protein